MRSTSNNTNRQPTDRHQESSFKSVLDTNSWTEPEENLKNLKLRIVSYL